MTKWKKKGVKEYSKCVQKNKKAIARNLKSQKRGWISIRNIKREREKQNVASPSPTKQVKEIVGKEKVSAVVKRQLFLGLVLNNRWKHSARCGCKKTKLANVKIYWKYS